MPAATIFFFARVIRAAAVGSVTRKRRAMSWVLTPITRRSTRALAASGASAGWVHIRTRRSRSSSTSPPGSAIVAWPSWRCVASVSSRTALRCAIDSARIRSITRRRAVVSSHAGGLSGVPLAGQCRAAASTASPRASSTRSSRRYCARSSDVSRPHSSRTTLSRTAPAASVTPTRSPRSSWPGGSPPRTTTAAGARRRWPSRARAARCRSSRRPARRTRRTARP